MGAPNHLAVYLSNRCNLQCKYCYVAVNQGEPAWLSLDDIRRNVDYFLSSVPAPDKKFTFLGGEPFLNFELLKGAVEYVREKAGPDVVLQTFTNGTNLTQDKLDWLDRRRVFVTVSLDGSKAANDSNRVFAGASERSVHDQVMERLSGVSKEGLGVSLVFDSRTVGGLLSNVERFRGMGFSRITFNPELYELWSEDKLKELAAVMAGFKRYYKAVLAGPRPFTVPILFSVLDTERGGPAWWHECHNVVLGPDGSFYACDKALTFTLDRVEDARTGDARAGLDWDGRREQLESARREVEAAVAGRKQHFCPMGVVFYARFSGVPSGRLLENFTRVSEIFGGALTELVAELGPTPAFRALYQDVQLV